MDRPLCIVAAIHEVVVWDRRFRPAIVLLMKDESDSQTWELGLAPPPSLAGSGESCHRQNHHSGWKNFLPRAPSYKYVHST